MERNCKQFFFCLGVPLAFVSYFVWEFFCFFSRFVSGVWFDRDRSSYLCQFKYWSWRSTPSGRPVPAWQTDIPMTVMMPSTIIKNVSATFTCLPTSPSGATVIATATGKGGRNDGFRCRDSSSTHGGLEPSITALRFRTSPVAWQNVDDWEYTRVVLCAILLCIAADCQQSCPTFAVSHSAVFDYLLPSTTQTHTAMYDIVYPIWFLVPERHNVKIIIITPSQAAD